MIIRKLASLGIAAFVGTAMIGAVAQPVHAGSRPVTVTAHPDRLTRIVPYGDLSLATTEGRRMLNRRVDVAVDQVCPDFSDEGALYIDTADCKHFAWAGARPQIKQAFDRAMSGEMLSAAIQITSVAGR